MKEFIDNELILNDSLLKICRDKTLQVTGVDVVRTINGYKSQPIVEAKICFIAVLTLLLGDKETSDRISYIGKYIHLNRSTVYTHKKNYLTKNNVTKEVYDNVDEIKNLVELEISNSFIIPKSSVLNSIELKLTDYQDYLMIELQKTDKLLQIIKDERKTN